MLYCLTPEYIKDAIDRLYNAIVRSCGNVALQIETVEYKGKAGGGTYTPYTQGSDGEVVVINTIPELSGVWQEIRNAFLMPWARFPKVEKYVEDNDLLKFIVHGDCDTKEQVWAKFEGFLKGWAYNEIMNHLHALGVYAKTEPTKTSKTVSHPATTVSKQTEIKPIHKNKAFLGGIGLTIASAIIGFLNAHVSPAIAMGIAGIISTILSAVEHKSASEIYKELIDEA